MLQYSAALSFIHYDRKRFKEFWKNKESFKCFLAFYDVYYCKKPIDRIQNLTTELCILAIKRYPNLQLNNIPEEFWNDEVFEALIRKDWNNFKDIPESKLTPTLCKIGIMTHEYVLRRYIPKSMINDELLSTSCYPDTNFKG